jgi:hypothetical protein
MSRIDYRHRIGGKGQAQGLPVRRGSHLYDVEPDIRYPEVISLGTTQGSQHQYGEAVYYRPPHLPVTFIVEPYISNHKANGGNLTRRQYFTIKRGQPVMAANKREQTVGVFVDDGSGSATTEGRTYADPAKMATNGTIVGFVRTDRYKLASPNEAEADAADVITESKYTGLTDGAGTGTTGQEDYAQITEDNPLSVSRFEQLSEEMRDGFRAHYTGLEDDNDQIATGGNNLYANVDSALFGETDMVKNVRVDADSYYYGSAAQVQGFIYPSTGGARRTLFYNEVDHEAGVTLPIEASDTDQPRTVQPIGDATTGDVAADNLASFKNSAVSLKEKPTIGLMHTDLEQTLSKKFHGFSTGTEERSVVKTGELLIPFLDVNALETFISNRTPLSFGGSAGNDVFNFTDQSEGRSGIKVGIYGEKDISAVNKASLLTDRDGGYANLYYNFAAPFLITDRFPTASDNIKPDLFGNYTLSDAGVISDTDGTFAGQFVDADAGDNKHGKVDMRALGRGDQVIGSVQYARDVPGETLENLRVNSIFQSRIIQGNDDRTYLNEGYRRLGSTADTGGIRQILADFGLMSLGGGNKEWASSTAPTFDGQGHDLSSVLREMVVEGVMGLVKCSFNTV